MRRGRKKEITPHLEDYLVAIYEITKEKPQKQQVARVSQIARKLGVSLPSVTNAMKRLSELGYVDYERYNVIALTQKGLKRAMEKESIQANFKDFFMNIMGLEKTTAEKLARSFSHYIDDKIRERFDRFYEILKNFSTENAKELEEFIKESRRLSEE